MTLSISEILFNHISLKVFALRKHLYLKGKKKWKPIKLTTITRYTGQDQWTRYYSYLQALPFPSCLKLVHISVRLPLVIYKILDHFINIKTDASQIKITVEFVSTFGQLYTFTFWMGPLKSLKDFPFYWCPFCSLKKQMFTSKLFDFLVHHVKHIHYENFKSIYMHCQMFTLFWK